MWGMCAKVGKEKHGGNVCKGRKEKHGYWLWHGVISVCIMQGVWKRGYVQENRCTKSSMKGVHENGGVEGTFFLTHET